LIVIGLLGAIALIVIAAINPIEQTNRARDARFKADAGQLISAIDRYFAAKSEFPWVTSGEVDNNEGELDFASSSTVDYGLCATTTCSASTETDWGELIAANELKQEFMERDFVQEGGGTDGMKKIMIGKPSGSSASVYACFIPASNSTKEKACDDGNVYTLSGGSRTAVATAACEGKEDSYVTNSWYVCVPE